MNSNFSNDQGGATPEQVQAAALWHGRLADDDSPETREEFYRWYVADPAHEAAYDEIESAFALVGAAAPPLNVRAMRSEAQAWIRSRQRARHLRFTGLAIVVAASLAFFLRGFIGERVGTEQHAQTSAYQAGVHQTAMYQTGEKEMRNAGLSDGSMVTLDNNSRIRVIYTGEERQVRLEEGHALFEVAKDSARPFRVIAGDHVITAHGTTFDVLRQRDLVRVALVEGIVTVAANVHGSVSNVAMVASDVLVANGSATTIQRVSDMSHFTSWSNRILIFDNESLGDAVSQVNRFTKRPIVLRHGELEGLRLSGDFHAGDPDTFVEAVRSYFGLSVERTSEAVYLDGPPRNQ